MATGFLFSLNFIALLYPLYESQFFSTLWFAHTHHFSWCRGSPVFETRNTILLGVLCPGTSFRASGCNFQITVLLSIELCLSDMCTNSLESIYI